MYEYVSKSQLKPYKTYCQSVLGKLQNELKAQYDISAHGVLIGSGAANMVTRDGDGVFDLDYNLVFTKIPENYDDPKWLKDTVRRVLDKYIDRQAFSFGQDSTSSITYRIHALNDKKAAFSFDVALIRRIKGSKNWCRLIHDKHKDVFVWNAVPASSKYIAKINAIKAAGKFAAVRNVYLKKKNLYLSRQDTDHPSFVVYVEAVNQVYQSISTKEGRKMAKTSGKTHSQSQMNHHANQGNPNNAAHKAAQNNHANQGNPNNSAYQSSRSGKK